MKWFRLRYANWARIAIGISINAKTMATGIAHRMDEWSDGEGNTLPPDNPGAFQNAMETAFYGPLGDLTVPVGGNR